MADAPNNGTNDSPRGRGQRARGGRPSRSRGGRGNRQRSPQVTERRNEQQGAAAAHEASAVVQPANRPTRGGAPRGRGRGEGRGSRRGRQAAAGTGQRTTIAAGRAFGGHLTAETETEDQGSEASVPFNADASVFVPERQKMSLPGLLADHQNLVPLISPRGFMRISAMGTTNVSSVQMKFYGIHVSGHVRSAGQPLTCHALRNGSRTGISPQTKTSNKPSNRFGDVPAVTRL
ncbi:putative NF-X1-type zinc finger protein NFXL1 [Rosellinia necatrix]|uniref:Putative NF-X1-type zinc finger protein NFXL1 n=1 Tax=Rosellinia necatrix TaxID=77044 RepID=A0A1S8A525_ROSNE|nr:putative NF-X1-type zinc finger protein NFXL1 [Rosellinia necatrix]